MSKKKECKICGEEFEYQCGEFSNHLKLEHRITREEYVVLTEHGGKKPKCQCGYCENDSKFINRKGEFHVINPEHRKFDWIQGQYILKFGEPKCETCGESVNFNRGVPYTYCSKKCKPGTWNQEKVRQTVRDKYGVDNVMDVQEIRDKQSESITETWNKKKGSILRKSKKTKLERHGDENYNNPEKMKSTLLLKYGVNSYSKTDEFREIASKTAIKTNEENKFLPIEKYEDTDLYYQGSYEKRFLDYCGSKGVLHQLENSKSFKYLKEDRFAGTRHLPDFKFMDDYIIEIKSTYIMNLQGGEKVIEAKRRAVKVCGMKYLLILDNDFSEFDDII
jgi:endogenous inhibitor of DNA gyrase (YacG/DUF329 family)